MITWFNNWNGCVHCSMWACSRIITSLLKHTHMRHWRAGHDFLCLCELEWMFYLLMYAVRVHKTLPYHSLFYHEFLCFVLARCWSSLIEPWKHMVKHLYAKNFYCISNDVSYFPYKYNHKKWIGFSSI
jgi:hypothetical protein